jgi:hypothetical protein
LAAAVHQARCSVSIAGSSKCKSCVRAVGRKMRLLNANLASHRASDSRYKWAMHMCPEWSVYQLHAVATVCSNVQRTDGSISASSFDPNADWKQKSAAGAVGADTKVHVSQQPPCKTEDCSD